MPAITYRTAKILTNTDLDTNFSNLDNFKLSKDSDIGAASIPVGSTAERNTTTVGAIRYNNETKSFEGVYNTNIWKSVGEKGYVGDPGANGVGATGYSGSKGVIGYGGSRGERGITGRDPLGKTGYTGSVGDAGYSGSRGTVGTTGLKGATGPTGPAGPAGSSPTNAIRYTVNALTKTAALPLTFNTTNTAPGAVNNPEAGVAFNTGGSIYVSKIDDGDGGIYLNRNDQGTLLDIRYLAASACKINVGFNTQNYTQWVPQAPFTLSLYNNISDYRLKENVIITNDNLPTLKQLKLYDFTIKESKAKSFSFMAHELQEIMPHLVTNKKDEVDNDNNPMYQSINYIGLVPFLFACVKELNKKLDKLTIKLQEKNANKI